MRDNLQHLTDLWVKHDLTLFLTDGHFLTEKTIQKTEKVPANFQYPTFCLSPNGVMNLLINFPSQTKIKK